MWSEFSTGSDTDVEDRREFWGEMDNTTESNESGDSDREEWSGGYWDGGEQPWDLGGMGAASIVGSGSDSGADDDYGAGMGVDALASAGVFGQPPHAATLAPGGVPAGMPLQGAAAGPPPGHGGPNLDAQIADLERRKQAAVRKDDLELAIKLRDEIRALKAARDGGGQAAQPPSARILSRMVAPAPLGPPPNSPPPPAAAGIAHPLEALPLPAPAEPVAKTKPRPKPRKPPPAEEEATECPYCHATVIKRGHVAGDAAAPSRFAQYLPRSGLRKDNRLAAWYSKFGYTGPSYCKGCAESFNSHLLRQKVRSGRVKCRRDQPCPRCTNILTGFKIPPHEIFEAVDASRAKGKKRSRPAADRDSPLLGPPGAAGAPAASKKKKATALAVAAIAIVTLSGFWGRDGAPSPQGPTSEQAQWTCGADFTALLTDGTLSAHEMATTCDGADPSATFDCAVDECAVDGKVPIGPRTCRCDGCVQAGSRCVGWVLEGRADSLAEAGCLPLPETTQTDNGYEWEVPGQMSRSQCEYLCSETTSCKSFALTDGRMTRAAPLPNSRGTCRLRSATAWPQPMAHGAGLGDGRQGLLWADESADQVWLWTLDDGGVLDGVDSLSAPDKQWMEAWTSSGVLNISGAPPQDLHLMWRFDRRSSQWEALRSSLTERPTPRAGPAMWTDSAGSLFLFGGLASDPVHYDSGVLPFSTASSPADVAELADLWHYDTTRLAWQLVSAGPEPHRIWHTVPANKSATAAPWPSTRARASTWRDGALQDAGTEVVWMYGGAGAVPGLGGGTFDAADFSDGMMDTASELWQYAYDPSQPAVPGRWTLATRYPWRNAANDVMAGLTGPEPALTCRLADDCPAPRLDAGSWKSPNAAAGGWIFGGVRIPVWDASIMGGWSDPDPELFSIMNKDMEADLKLNDLWHFNGDLRQPRWTRTPQTEAGRNYFTMTDDPWPPVWQNPRGWVSDADGGELWVVGDSGQPNDAATQPEIVSSMWRFSIAASTWEHVEGPASTHLPHAVEWPVAREQAAVAPGVMFGGLENSISGGECASAFTAGNSAMGPTPSRNTRPSAVGDGPPLRHLLSGLWRWEDDAAGRE
eukprot:COSAG04_NODE_125_length_24621_cov_23.574015_3_plen_1093_part_00